MLGGNDSVMPLFGHTRSRHKGTLGKGAGFELFAGQQPS
jgi:hypothetical protein